MLKERKYEHNLATRLQTRLAVILFVMSSPSISSIPIVDTHHHLWDLSDPDHHYKHLRHETSGDHVAGDFNRLKSTYSVKEYLHDTQPCRVVKSVHVAVSYDRDIDPWGDLQWLQKQAETNENRLPNGLVAHADLTDDKLRDKLSTMTSRFSNVRGIRQMLNWLDGKARIYTMCDRPDYLLDNKWKDGFSLLNQYGLSFDLQIYQHQMKDAAELARQHPDTPIILNHCGMPYDLNLLDQWKAGMSILAEQPNISCKLSGLVMFQHTWTIETLRPYIEYALHVFGADRCLFGSNFPVDKLNATFEQLVGAYMNIVQQAGLTSNELEQVFSGNACRIYRL